MNGDQKETAATWVRRAPSVRRAMSALRVPRARVEKREIVETLAHKAPWEPPAHKAPLGRPGPAVHPGPKAPKENRAQWVLKVHKDHKAFKAQAAPRALLARRGQLALMEIKVKSERLAQPVRMAATAFPL